MKERKISGERLVSLSWVAGRLAWALAMLFLGSFTLFVLVWVLPGDAATNVAARHGAEALAQARAQMGLDLPLLTRYLNWLGDLIHADLGNTLVTKLPVAPALLTPLISTLTLAGLVVAGVIFFTVPAALYFGARPSRLGSFLSSFCVAVAALPEFVVAIGLLVVLSLSLKWLPVLSSLAPASNVFREPIVLVLPALTLWIVVSASLFRRVRALASTYAKTSFVRDARLAGLPTWRVLLVHLLPSAAGALTQLLAYTLPYLLGGTVVVETVTSFPGLGYTLVAAVNNREAPTVMAIGTGLMLVAILAYTAADLVARRHQNIGAYA